MRFISWCAPCWRFTVFNCPRRPSEISPERWQSSYVPIIVRQTGCHTSYAPQPPLNWPVPSSISPHSPPLFTAPGGWHKQAQATKLQNSGVKNLWQEFRDIEFDWIYQYYLVFAVNLKKMERAHPRPKLLIVSLKATRCIYQRSKGSGSLICMHNWHFVQ